MDNLKLFNDIKTRILNSSNVFVMGHKGIDLDAFGSCLGIYYIATSFGKETYIVLEEENSDTSILKAKEELEKRNINIKFFKYEEIKKEVLSDSLLIIVDVNKKPLMQSEELYMNVSKKIVLDHHPMEENEDYTISYIDNKISSTSEIVVAMIVNNDISIPSYIASIMLGGISIDTNNFILKTTYNTYLTASILTRLGADNSEVQHLLKENVSEYFELQNVIQNIFIVKEKFAICVCDNKIYDKEFLAKVASTTVGFDRVEVSFAIGKIDNETVGISTRSICEISAAGIMERFGGGGHKTDAAAQIKKADLNEIKEELLKILKGDEYK